MTTTRNRKPAPTYVAATWYDNPNDYTVTGTVTRQNEHTVHIRWEIPRDGGPRDESIDRRTPGEIRLYTADEYVDYLTTPDSDDDAPHHPTWIERETWRGRRVVLAWQRSEVRRGLHPSAPQYIVAEIHHGNGIFVLADPATGQIARADRHGHLDQLIEVDDQGRDLRGYYAERAETISMQRDSSGTVTVDTYPTRVGWVAPHTTPIEIIGRHGDSTIIGLDQAELRALHAAIGARIDRFDRNR